jgi:folate-binding protein YgfZ
MSAEVYKLIRVTGSDAGEFLQGQLTQDIELVAQSGTLPGAWCNPKGRVISMLRILMIEGGYGLVLPASMAESVCQRLAVYRLRAHVGLDVAGSDWACLVINEDDDIDKLETLGLRPEQDMNACRSAHGLIAVNVGIEEACVELMGITSDIDKTGITDSAPYDELRAAKIRAGIPEITQHLSERFTPHMLNLDLLGAISFDKGCYVGQEVVARTQNLGSSKRRIMRYCSDAPLASGDKLSDGDRDVGEVINVIGNDLLAVTAVDVRDKPLTAKGAQIRPVTMPYTIGDGPRS